MDPAQKSKVAQMLGHHFRQTIKSPVDEKRAGDLNINQGNKLKMLRDIAKQNNENQKRQVSEGRNNQGVRKSMEQEEIFDDINQS